MRRTLVGRIRIFLLPTDDALNERGGNNRRIYRAEAFSSTYRAHAKLLFFIIVSSSSRYTLVALPSLPFVSHGFNYVYNLFRKSIPSSR